MSCAKTAEPIDLPFGLWACISKRNYKFIRIHQVAPVCPYCLHLATVTEPSICGGNAAFDRVIITKQLLVSCLLVVRRVSLNGAVSRPSGVRESKQYEVQSMMFSDWRQCFFSCYIAVAIVLLRPLRALTLLGDRTPSSLYKKPASIMLKLIFWGSWYCLW